MLEGILTAQEAPASGRTGIAIPAGHLAARAALACATQALCAAYLDALCRGEMRDPAAFARLLCTEWGDACTAFIAAWQQGGGIEENTFVVETAARGFARIPGCDAATCGLIEDLLLGFVHETLLPASLKLPQ